MSTFKEIQLVGFKSFADKTVVPIGDGVTCIVGPNGCGKSNVADAIRWVLGEQSARMMRGSQMMDVIFGGTEKRKQMSFCEVTLKFDNTKRVFDIDSDEVEMTRRLYRDGESEYLLNRQTSRMKILTGLLHGAGAGKEGYSIIGQGRIEQIMNARPEDRRAIFEEATGILMFKDRKADAERKLKMSQDNLFVFVQRMQEVERQLAPLQKAADNARKYTQLYDSLRHHEMNTFIYRHDTAAGEKAKVQAKIDAYTATIQQLNQTLEDLKNEYESCRNELSQGDVALEDLRERLLRYSVGMEHRSGETKILNEKARSVKAKLSSAQEDIVYSTKRIDEIERDIRRTQAYCQRNNDRIQNLKNTSEQAKTQLDALTEQITTYEYMTGEHRKKVMDTFKDLSEIRENMGSLSAQKDLLKERLQEIQASMERIYAQREEDKKEYDLTLARQNELNDFLGREQELLEDAQIQVKGAEDRIEALVKQIYDTQAQISSLTESLKTYSALRDRFEGYIYSVKRLMNDSKYNPALSQKIQGMIADVVTTSKEYEVAIETAFGGAMQNVITETREDARYLIEYLKNNRAGQVTFLPIEALRPHFENEQIRSAVKDRGAIGYAIDLVTYDKKYENIIHNLLGNTLICDNIQNATQISRRYPRAFRIVTLDGDVISTSGSMSGGSRRDNAGNLLANERKVKEIEEGIENRKSALQRYAQKRTTMEEERDRYEEQLEELKQKFTGSRLELASVTEKQAQLLRAVSSAESEYAVYVESCKALESRLMELDSEYVATNQGVSNLNAMSDEANSAIADMNEKYEKLVKERTEKTEKLNDWNVEIASLESAVKANNETVTRLETERDQLIAKITLTRASIPVIERELEEINRQAEKTALTAEEQAVVDDLRKQVAQLNEKKNSINERIKKIDEERFLSSEKMGDLNVKVHNQEMVIVKIDSDLELLGQRIAEEYSATYEDCLPYKEEGYDISQSANQIANFKRQLTMLGPVNPNAVAEYEEVHARYEKMEIERQDLDKAISDITKALNDIRDEMLRIFNDGFDKINKNFKNTFKELFGGGRAELQMDYTETEDPLNAGVEIVACPPGKTLKKISLLSGGERALTAIAILFAIIQMRPMPFCVLDEIEAALDEANVGRYAKYLKKFAQDTQFIVITHRKPTMENADILFGVTMEERGVSKIVSVKLSDVEQQLGGDTVQ